ncbi:MAG: MerR family transcriptional regulator [Acidimicrobiales bacterium]
MAALPVSATDDAGDGHNVDEVARITGTTVRTIRWYQSEGLLAPPRRDGRVARYDGDHVARLEAIRDLQAHGLITAIRRLLDRAPDIAATRALAFVQAAVSPSVEGETEVISAAEGAVRLGVQPTRGTAEQLEDLGIIRTADDGRWQIVAPAVFNASVELAAHGVPLAERLRLTEVLRQYTEAMASAMVEMFVERLWRPSEASNDPADPGCGAPSSVRSIGCGRWPPRRSSRSSTRRSPARPRPPPSASSPIAATDGKISSSLEIEPSAASLRAHGSRAHHRGARRADRGGPLRAALLR